MTTELRRHGDEYVLVIGEQLLAQIGVSGETSFEVTASGESLVLTPVSSTGQRLSFNEAVERVHSDFGDAMRKLAE